MRIRETEAIRELEHAVELTVANLQQFLGIARKEGFDQAIEALEEYYKVKQVLDAAMGKPKQPEGDKPKQDEQDKPDVDKRPDVEPTPPPPAPPESGGQGRWGCDDVRCNVYSVEKDAKCPERVIGASRGWPSYEAACLAAQRDANSKVPRGCNKRHCNCTDKCRKM